MHAAPLTQTGHAPTGRVTDEPYVMPRVRLGDPVLWSFSAGGEPSAAVVTRVNPRAVSLMVFPADSRLPVVREAVRHVSDPELARTVSEAGVWRLTDLAERLAKAEDTLGLR